MTDSGDHADWFDNQIDCWLVLLSDPAGQRIQ